MIVTVPDQKKLQFVQIYPHLQLGHAIQQDSECCGVCVSGEDIFVTCKTSLFDVNEIRVLGLNGNEKRRVPVDRNCSPYEITLSPSGKKIFFTDNYSEIVTCMTVDGRIVYKYQHNLKDARGLYCDSEDNLFVCDQQSGSLQAITSDGKSGGTLLTSRNGLAYPQCIAYRSHNNELIVGCDGLDHLLVYKLKN